jgi:hypothetical protein
MACVGKKNRQIKATVESTQAGKPEEHKQLHQTTVEVTWEQSQHS